MMRLILRVIAYVRRGRAVAVRTGVQKTAAGARETKWRKKKSEKMLLNVSISALLRFLRFEIAASGSISSDGAAVPTSKSLITMKHKRFVIGTRFFFSFLFFFFLRS